MACTSIFLVRLVLASATVANAFYHPFWIKDAQCDHEGRTCGNNGKCRPNCLSYEVFRGRCRGADCHCCEPYKELRPSISDDMDSKSDCDYSSKFSPSHTMNLPPNRECGVFHKTGVSNNEKATILKKHNELRAKVANGLESRQPGATNMLEMQWNNQLAEVAQAWAEQCPEGHDTYNDRKICSRDYSVGQNLAWRWTTHNAATVWDATIQEWYDEVKDLPLHLIDSFDSYKKAMIGHYTQIVWADTYEVGCGAIHYKDTHKGTTYPESKIYMCNYGPAGNIIGQPVYEAAYTDNAIASNCRNGLSSAYPGLCATPTTK